MLNKIKSKILLFVVSLCGGCGVVCAITGCFAYNEVNNTKISHIKKEIFHHKNFVKSWNNTILKNSYFSDFNTSYILLPNTNDKEVIEKLNKIFSQKRVKKQIEYFNKRLTNNNMLNLPIKEYIKFLKNLKFRDNAFSSSLKEEEIQKLILFMMHSDKKYISFNTLKKLTWTFSFRKFFKDNKKLFLKKGFSENIINYEKYAKIIKL